MLDDGLDFVVLEMRYGRLGGGHTGTSERESIVLPGADEENGWIGARTRKKRGTALGFGRRNGV